MDGVRVRSAEDVVAALQRHQPGDRMRVTYVDRTGVEKTTTVTLAADPHLEVVPVEATGSRHDAGAAGVSRALAREEIGEVMALPWIGILDTAIGMANMALARRAKKPGG